MTTQHWGGPPSSAALNMAPEESLAATSVSTALPVERPGKKLDSEPMNSSRLVRAGRIFPSGSRAYSCRLQVTRIRRRSSSLRRGSTWRELPFRRSSPSPSTRKALRQRLRVAPLALDSRDQLDHRPSLRGTRQPSASSEHKSSHVCGSISSAAASAVVSSLRCSSFMRALISRWCWARRLSSAF